ncbi:hypothetical protein M5689_017231 [Euphorbia peplus]|nr:hypothetical protein M5689_017231 [Euphorbia peplus]
MKMVVNIIKLSSFSIAKMSLGVGTESSLVKKNLAPVVTASVTVSDQPEIPAGSRKSSQQLRSRSKPYSSFVMQKAEDGGKGSTYMIREGNSLIDGMASDYIKKFHEKNSREHVKSKLYRPLFPSRTVK